MSATTVVPSDLLQGNPVDSIKINRVPVRVQSDTQSYTNNQTIQFTLPNDFCDLRNSYLTFFAQAVLNGGTFIRFVYPIGCIFNRARIYLGSTLIEDIQDWGVLQGMFTLASEFASVTNVTLPGSYTDATRATQTNAGRQYMFHLRLESLQRAWPLHKIKLPLRIMLTLGAGPDVLEYDGAAPVAGIQFNNAYFNYHSIQVPQEVDSMLDAAIAAGSAKIRVHTFENYQTVVPTSSSSTIMLPFKHKTVNALFCLFRPNASVNSAAVVGKFTDIYAGSQVLINAFAKVGNTVYPADRYDMAQGGTTGLGYLQLQLPFANLMYNDFRAHDRQLDTFMSQTAANRIVVPIDLRRDNSPNASLWDNGIDTSGSASSSQFGLTFQAAPGDLSVDVFCKYEAVITILPGGNVMVDQ